MSKQDWSKDSWRNYPRLQAPQWYDGQILEETASYLEQLPGLVFAEETNCLVKELEKAAKGELFVLQCGNCSENFTDCNGTSIQNFFRILLQMSTILSFLGNKKILKIGRIAGQYAKPRSNDTETVNGMKLPVYRGDMVNSFEPVLEKRKHDPARMLQGYFRSAATLNLIRSFSKGGYAALDQMQKWEEHDFSAFPSIQKYRKLASELAKTVNFMKTIGVDMNNTAFSQVDLYTSHEALLLEYEQAMTRKDSENGLYYDTSAHMLWVGDRTRQPDGAHIEFLRGINNPVGIKVGPDYQLNHILETIVRLNPQNRPGKICLIIRFGVKEIESLLPKLIQAVKSRDYNVVWLCDPMHGNTYISETGEKVRKLDNILGEMELFFEIHKKEQTVPGGIHLELTPDNVTECIGGEKGDMKGQVQSRNYTSTCDPRLNAEQSVEVAFFVSQLLKP